MLPESVAVVLDELEAAEEALRAKLAADPGEDPFEILSCGLVGAYARPGWHEIHPVDGLLLPLERVYKTGQLCFKFCCKDHTQLYIVVCYDAVHGPPCLTRPSLIELHYEDASGTRKLDSACVTKQLETVLDLMILMSGVS